MLSFDPHLVEYTHEDSMTVKNDYTVKDVLEPEFTQSLHGACDALCDFKSDSFSELGNRRALPAFMDICDRQTLRQAQRHKDEQDATPAIQTLTCQMREAEK